MHLTHSTPLFRVFVSSTFADFKPERDYLDKVVFKNVRRFCEDRGARFQQVDLRWGISEVAAREMRAAELCELELRRCQELSPRPNFVVLSGDRYGWCPPPRIMSQMDWGLLTQVIVGQDKADLESAYALDNFAIPPRWVFRQERADLADVVAAVLSRGATIAFPDDASRRLPYEASITHQEIWRGALSDETALDHVFVFGRHFTDLPATITDRAKRAFADYDDHGILDLVKLDRQGNLRESLLKLLPPTSTYAVNGSYQDWPRSSLIEEFGRRLERHLCRVIQEELTEFKTHSKTQDAEQEAKDEIDSMLVGTVPRDALIAEILAFAGRQPNRPTFVVGPGGTGKSTLLGMLVRQLRAAGIKVVWISVAAAGSVADLTSVLNLIVGRLATELGLLSEPSEDLAIAAAELARLLKLPLSESLYVFLDGLDQLAPHDRSHELWWLPHEVNVRLIASAAVQIHDTSLLAGAIIDRSNSQERIEVGNLGFESAMDAVDRSLNIRGRRVADRQRDYVGAALSSDNSAIFARLVSHAVESRASFSDPRELPESTRELFQHLCEGWASEAEHGRELVRGVLAALALSRGGLAEDEILDLINRSDSIHQSIRRRFPFAPDRQQIPFSIWSRLRNDLQPFLVESRGQQFLTLFHSQIRTAAGDWACPTEEIRRDSHAVLARYFLDRGMTASRGTSERNGLVKRFLAEATHHAIESGRPSVIRDLSKTPVLRSLDEFLGEGRTQASLQAACRSLGRHGPVDWPCLSVIAHTFMKRQEKLAKRYRPSIGIADLLYAGELAAVDTLIRAQSGIQQQVSHFATAEILDSTGHSSEALRHREAAGDLAGTEPELSLIQRELFASLKTAHVAAAPNSETLPAGSVQQSTISWRGYVVLVLCTGVLTLAMSIYAVSNVMVGFAVIGTAAACGDLIVNGNTSTLEQIGGFTLLALFLHIMAAMLQALMTLPSRACVRWLRDQTTAPNSRSSLFWASWMCYLAESVRYNRMLSRPIVSRQSSEAILDLAVTQSPPIMGARILTLYAETISSNDARLVDIFKSLPTKRLSQLIRGLHVWTDVAQPGLPIIRAIALSGRLPESLSLLARQISRLPEMLKSRSKPKRSRLLRWLWKKDDNDRPLEMIDILRELPRPIRAELLLWTDQPEAYSLETSQSALIRRSWGNWQLFRSTHLAERCLLAIPWLTGSYLLINILWGFYAGITRPGSLVSPAVVFIALVVEATVLVGTAVLIAGWLEKSQKNRAYFKRGNFGWSGPQQLYFLLRHREPPWDWEKWLPIVYGSFYLQLIFSPRTNWGSGRSGYGTSLDQDLDRYSRDWSELIRRYSARKWLPTHSLAPAMYAYLGPAGLAEWLLARLILSRGWRAAVDGPAFPPEAWERVVKTLTQPSWLGRSPEFVADVLTVPAAAKVMLLKPFPKASSSPVIADAKLKEEFERKTLTQANRICDLMPVTLHRGMVGAVALAIAAAAVYPSNPFHVPLPEYMILGWVFFVLLSIAYSMPHSQSIWPRWICTIFSCIAFVFVIVGDDVVRNLESPLESALTRGQMVVPLVPMCLPIVFFAPWVVATFRGSLLWNPTKLRLLANKMLAIVLVPLLGGALSWGMFAALFLWVEGEKLLVKANILPVPGVSKDLSQTPVPAPRTPNELADDHNRNGVKAFHAGDWETAIHEYEASIQIHLNLPNSEEALLGVRVNLAAAQREAGHCETARQALVELIPRLDELSANRERPSIAVARSRYHLAVCERTLGNLAEAEVRVIESIRQYDRMKADESNKQIGTFRQQSVDLYRKLLESRNLDQTEINKLVEELNGKDVAPGVDGSR